MLVLRLIAVFAEPILNIFVTMLFLNTNTNSKLLIIFIDKI